MQHPQMDGPPQLQAVAGTLLYYAVNSLLEICGVLGALLWNLLTWSKSSEPEISSFGLKDLFTKLTE